MESQTFVIRQLLKFGLFQYKMPLVKLASKICQLTDGLGYVVCLVGSLSGNYIRSTPKLFSFIVRPKLCIYF